MSKNSFNRILTNLSIKKEPIIQRKSISVEQLDTLNLVTSSTNIEIGTHEKQSIDVVLETYETGPGLSVSEIDFAVDITVEKSNDYNFNFTDLFNPAVRLLIKVPKDTIENWHLKTSSGNVTINQIVAHSLSATASSGNLILSELTLQTGIFRASSGNLSMNQVNVEKSIIKTSSGSMTLENSVLRKGELICTSGNIKVNQSQAAELSIKVTSGNIKLLEVQAEYLEARTTSGNIKNEYFNQELDATVNITVRSGNISCKLPMMIQKETSNKLIGVIGNGNNLISLNSNSGNIFIS